MTDLSPFRHSPKLQILGYYGKPTTPPFTFDALAEVEYRSADSQGLVAGLRRYNLSNNVDPDDINDRKNRAVSLNYTTNAFDNAAEDWTQFVTQSEIDLRQARITDYNNEKAQLTSIANPSDTQRQRLVEVNNILDQLSLTSDGNSIAGVGYSETPPDPFGDGASGVYRFLSEPNIPFRWLLHAYRDANSNNETVTRSTLDQDRPFTLALYRFKSHEKQATPLFQVRWGLWMLEIRGDQKTRLYKFNKTYKDPASGRVRQLTPDIRTRFENDLQELIDLTTKTAADMETINANRAAINAIKVNAKKQGRTNRQFTTDEKAQITALTASSNDIRAAKKHASDGDTTAIRDLKKLLFAIDHEIHLHDTAPTLWDQPLFLTFLPQQRGYLTITLEGNDPYTVEDKTITKTQKDGTLWDNTAQIELRGNGGAFFVRFGYPDFQATGFYSFPIEPGFDLSESDVIFNVDEFLPPGTDVDHSHTLNVPGVSGTVNMPPTYIGTLTLTSDGRYAPWIYREDVYIVAGERDGSDDVVWDSDEHLDQGSAPIVDIRPNFEEGKRSVSYEIIVAGNAGLPDCHDRLCRIWADEPHDLESCDLYGLIKTTPRDSQLMSADIDQPSTGPEYSTVTLNAYDLMLVLDEDQMVDTPVGDNTHLGQHFRDVIAGRGARETEMNGIGESTGRILPRARPGEKAAVKPTKHANRGGYLKHLIEAYGTDLEFWCEPSTGVYQLAEYPTDIVAHFYTGFPSYPYRQNGVIQAGVRVEGGRGVQKLDDYSEFFNRFRVHGDIDPVTKKPLEGLDTIWESLLVPSDPTYINRIKEYQLLNDQALQTENDIAIALRNLRKRHGKPGKFLAFLSYYLRELSPRMRITVDGILCEIVRIPSGSIMDDTMEIVARRVF